MICKECAAIIKNNEEYCRRCGSLVINFNKKENPNLKDLCIKNDFSGKFRSLMNLFSSKDKKNHSLNTINKDRQIYKANHIGNVKDMLNKDNLSNGFKDISNKIDFYMKDTLGFDDDTNSSDNELSDMINDFKKLFK